MNEIDSENDKMNEIDRNRNKMVREQNIIEFISISVNW